MDVEIVVFHVCLADNEIIVADLMRFFVGIHYLSATSIP